MARKRAGLFREQESLILLVLLSGLALGVALSVHGCGKISPTNSPDQALQTPAAEPPQSGLPAEVLWPKMQISCDTVYIEGVISEHRWSFFDLDLPGRYHWFIVPSGAVEGRNVLTIEVVRNTYWDEDSGKWSYMAEFSFSPDGLVFDPWRQPRLIIDAFWLDLGEGEDAVLRYCNEDTGLWREIARDVVSHGIVEFYIEHFSLYAIS